MTSSTPHAGPALEPSTRRGPGRHLGATLALPILWLSLGCLEDDALGDAPSGSSGTSGRSGSMSGGGSGGGLGNMGGSGLAGSGSQAAEDAGEIGIFVGMTAAHNVVRREQALGELTWSEDLAAYAQEWSEDLAGRCGVIQHRAQRMYGENIAMRGSSRLVEAFTPDEALAGWAAEEACWDFGTIQGSERCDAQCTADLNSNGCGHYTQLVWRNTRRLGCGYATCQDTRFTYEIWVCNYDPPGNFIGQAPY